MECNMVIGLNEKSCANICNIDIHHKNENNNETQPKLNIKKKERMKWLKGMNRNERVKILRNKHADGQRVD